MKLGLVSPLPPSASPAAAWVQATLAHLRELEEVLLLPRSPEQVDAVFDGDAAPAAELPARLAAGTIDVAAYVFAGNDYHAFQLRYVREHPGILVLLDEDVHPLLARMTEASGDLAAYRGLLVEEYGDAARTWPERFLWRVDADRVRRRLPLLAPLIGPSREVLARPAAVDRLRARYPGARIGPLPDEPREAALALSEAARRLVSGPSDSSGQLGSGRAVAMQPPDGWPSVEVVIVSYNSRRIIGPALESILAQDYPDLVCTMIDNASRDGTAEYVRAQHPGIQVVDSPVNLGFAGGNNLAFARSSAKYVVLFNQDAIARPDFVRELVRVAERDPMVAAVGAKMLMLRCPTVINSAGIVVNETGFAVDRQIGEKDEDPSPVPVEVFGACGGAKLIRRSVLTELGGFDTAFFMYFEDVDLCWRIRLAGHSIRYAPLAEVRHDWHGDLDAPVSTPAAGSAGPAADAGRKGGANVIDPKTRRRRLLCERNRLQCLVKNYELRTLLGVLRALWRYDGVRHGWVRDAIRGGREVAYFRMVRAAIRSGWRWNLLHLPGLWVRRRRVQRLRRVPDAVLAEFIARGVGEPSYVGDLEVICDRFSAQSTPHLRIGRTDGMALGPGWYGVEAMPGADWDLRWTKGKAWAYLTSDRPVRRLFLRVSRGPRPTDLELHCGRFALGSQPVPGPDLAVLEFALPAAMEARTLLELRLETGTFVPAEHGSGEDRRALGIRVAEIWSAE